MSNEALSTLDDDLRKFVETQVSQGRYGSANEVLSAGLRLLEQQNSRLEALRNALVLGEESGRSTEFDVEAFIASKRTAQFPPV